MEISCTVIGNVEQRDGCRIVLQAPYKHGLKGLAGFGHLQVVWFADQAGNAGSAFTVIPKPYAKGPEQIGVFATRSPYRPNSLCISTACVVDVDEEQGILQLGYIDAEDGTPVLDIKPYHGSEDRVREYKTPVWCAHWPQWIEDSEHFSWEEEFLF